MTDTPEAHGLTQGKHPRQMADDDFHLDMDRLGYMREGEDWIGIGEGARRKVPLQESIPMPAPAETPTPEYTGAGDYTTGQYDDSGEQTRYHANGFFDAEDHGSIDEEVLTERTDGRGITIMGEAAVISESRRRSRRERALIGGLAALAVFGAASIVAVTMPMPWDKEKAQSATLAVESTSVIEKQHQPSKKHSPTAEPTPSPEVSQTTEPSDDVIPSETVTPSETVAPPAETLGTVPAAAINVASLDLFRPESFDQATWQAQELPLTVQSMLDPNNNIGIILFQGVRPSMNAAIQATELGGRFDSYPRTDRGENFSSLPIYFDTTKYKLLEASLVDYHFIDGHIKKSPVALFEEIKADGSLGQKFFVENIHYGPSQFKDSTKYHRLNDKLYLRTLAAMQERDEGYRTDGVRSATPIIAGGMFGNEETIDGPLTTVNKNNDPDNSQCYWVGSGLVKDAEQQFMKPDADPTKCNQNTPGIYESTHVLVSGFSVTGMNSDLTPGTNGATRHRTYMFNLSAPEAQMVIPTPEPSAEPTIDPSIQPSAEATVAPTDFPTATPAPGGDVIEPPTPVATYEDGS